MNCAVEGCPAAEATKTIRVTASLSDSYSRLTGCPPYQEVEMDVPLCDGHYDVVTHDALRGLSIA